MVLNLTHQCAVFLDEGVEDTCAEKDGDGCDDGKMIKSMIN